MDAIGKEFADADPVPVRAISLSDLEKVPELVLSGLAVA